MYLRFHTFALGTLWKATSFIHQQQQRQLSQSSVSHYGPQRNLLNTIYSKITRNRITTTPTTIKTIQRRNQTATATATTDTSPTTSTSLTSTDKINEGKHDSNNSVQGQIVITEKAAKVYRYICKIFH